MYLYLHRRYVYIYKGLRHVEEGGERSTHCICVHMMQLQDTPIVYISNEYMLDMHTYYRYRRPYADLPPGRSQRRRKDTPGRRQRRRKVGGRDDLPPGRRQRRRKDTSGRRQRRRKVGGRGGRQGRDKRNFENPVCFLHFPLVSTLVSPLVSTLASASAADPTSAGADLLLLAQGAFKLLGKVKF